MQLPTHNRYDHVPLPARPTYTWPNGARLALVVSNNIEHFAFRAGLGSDSAQLGAPQTHRNYAWRDYGNRVGLWYMLDLLDELALPCSHNVNTAALDACPEIAPALLRRGDEFVGHGRTNAERQDGLFEAEERRLILDSAEGIERHTGRRPKGWMGPWLAETGVTLDLLKEAGFDYVMDWPADDQPFWMRTRAGPILSIPYSVEINDSPALAYRQHTGRDFGEMAIDHFDELLHQSAKYPLVCSIVLHTFLVGQPYRLRALRRALEHILAQRERLWITRPGELAAHVAGLPRGIVPGSEMLPEAGR
jgi:peptidoglycan/xylan/chitin deacetylase (PgdA/CDA1 family)